MKGPEPFADLFSELSFWTQDPQVIPDDLIQLIYKLMLARIMEADAVPAKKSYEELYRGRDAALRISGIGTLWRHRNGTIYEITGVDVDTADGEQRIRYKERVGPNVAPGARNYIEFSRPVAEWTLDRFTRLV